MTTALAIAALLVSGLSLFLAWRNRLDARTQALTAHVANVVLELRDIRSDVTDFSWQRLGQEILIRNDGPAAINVTNLSLAYGDRYAYSRYPTHWTFDLVPPGRFDTRLLAPGEARAYGAPDTRVGVPVLGPVARLTDVHGRVWQRTTWGYRQLNRWDRDQRRRDLWFERRPWFAAVDGWFGARMHRKLLKRPRRRPWELRVVEWLWGCRVGGRDGLATLPWNPPPVWQWSGLVPTSPPAPDIKASETP